MSNSFERAFDQLYSTLTRSMGLPIVATVGAYAVNKPAILSTVGNDEGIVLGGMAEGGTFDIQMKVSDFSSQPPKGTLITCNGMADGKTLTVHECPNHGAVYMIRAVDYASLDT